MNTLRPPRVLSGIIGVLLGGLCACVDVQGGAVEAGWDLRFPDGRRTDSENNVINCKAAGLSEMALSMVSSGGGGEPCSGTEDCQFPCSNMGFGTTDFVIPEGVYAISLDVLDLQGQPLGPGDGIVTPGPVVRRVRTGEITSLSVNLIIVDR